MASTPIDALIHGEMFMPFSKAEKNITLSFWEAIKQHDIAAFDCLIVFFVMLNNTQRLRAASYLLVLFL